MPIRRCRKAKVAASQPVASPEPSPAEVSAAVADKVVGVGSAVPDHEKPRAQATLEEAVKQRTAVTNEAVGKVEEAMKQEARRWPYRIDFFEDPYGPFYKPDWEGMQMVVWLNRRHPFFEVFYLAPSAHGADWIFF